jgi:hypothetical protein
MKFLTIATVKDVFYTLPQAEQNKLMKSTIEWTIDRMKKSKVKGTFYVMVNSSRLMSIGDSNSLEEYAQGLQSPLAQAGYVNYESCPLIEMDEKTWEAYLASYKAAK